MKTYERLASTTELPNRTLSKGVKIIYDVPKGFRSLSEAIRAVNYEGHNGKFFRYIYIFGMYYGIYETKIRAIMISKEGNYFKTKDGIRVLESCPFLCQRETTPYIPEYRTEECFAIKRDMLLFNRKEKKGSVKVFSGTKKEIVPDSATAKKLIITFGKFCFSSYIPLTKIDYLDGYFSEEEKENIQDMLKKNSENEFVSYNPFTQKGETEGHPVLRLSPKIVGRERDKSMEKYLETKKQEDDQGKSISEIIFGS